jgi:hypothetical protein
MPSDIKTTDIQVVDVYMQPTFLIQEVDAEYLTPQLSLHIISSFIIHGSKEHPQLEILRNNEVIATYQSHESGTLTPDISLSLTSNFKSNASQLTPPIFSEKHPLAAKFFENGDILRLYSREINHGQLIQLLRSMARLQTAVTRPDFALTK